MLVDFSWYRVFWGSRFGVCSPYWDFSMTFVMMGDWFFLDLVDLLVHSIIKTYMMYGSWMLCCFCDVLCFMVLCSLCFLNFMYVLLIDQVLVLD